MTSSYEMRKPGVSLFKKNGDVWDEWRADLGFSIFEQKWAFREVYGDAPEKKNVGLWMTILETPKMNPVDELEKIKSRVESLYKAKMESGYTLTKPDDI